MTLPIYFAPAATEDVRVACRWLDDVQPALGDELISELHRIAQLISQHPDMYERVGRGCRRAVLRRYDYAIVYRVRNSQIEILGMLHCRLDPSIVAARLQSGN